MSWSVVHRRRDGPARASAASLAAVQVAELVRSRELLVNLTLRELRGRYKRSVLGWGWSLLNPLASKTIYSLVFRFILKVRFPAGSPSGLKAYGVCLLCGLLSWNFFALTTGASMGALIGNASLIKKAAFRREAVVLATVGAQLMTFLIELGLLSVVVLAFYRRMILPWLAIALVLVVLLAAFTTGIALIFSGLNVYFRDLQHLWTLTSQLLFYASPVVYPVSLINDSLKGGRQWLRWVYEANPIGAFIQSFRNLLYDFRMPPGGRLAYIVAISFVSLFGGLRVFARLDRRLAEEL